MPFAELDQAAAYGMSVAYQARQHPDRTAIVSPRGNRSYQQLNGCANQLARHLRAGGILAGDGIALLCPNRPEFADSFFACQRMGVRLTPINWHLSGEEIAYIVKDSGARALIADASLAPAASRAANESTSLAVKLAVDGGIEGFENFQPALDARDDSDIDTPVLGDTMLYTSGTTGRPKGVRRAMPNPADAVAGMKLLATVFGFEPRGNDTTLATGPLYHSGPIHLCLSIPVNAGIPTILMERWDAEEMLRLIDENRVTHTYCVPTMFSRLLALGKEIRRKYDISSMRFIIHGAAPCPVEVKRAIIDWFGPIVTEIYAATEGMGTLVTSHEWLSKPGTVGKPAPDAIHILDENFARLPAGEIGTVFIRPVAGGDFEYWGAPDKTSDAMRQGFFTVGDMGYIDDDGYLFLTGRSAEVIISGGSNIYPAEIDSILINHPSVCDAAAYGAADTEWGEVVHAAIVLEPGRSADQSLIDDLTSCYADSLPTYKRPRELRFLSEIPRSGAGKILRRVLRDKFGRHAKG